MPLFSNKFQVSVNDIVTRLSFASHMGDEPAVVHTDIYMATIDLFEMYRMLTEAIAQLQSKHAIKN